MIAAATFVPVLRIRIVTRISLGVERSFRTRWDDADPDSERFSLSEGESEKSATSDPEKRADNSRRPRRITPPVMNGPISRVDNCAGNPPSNPSNNESG